MSSLLLPFTRLIHVRLCRGALAAGLAWLAACSSAPPPPEPVPQGDFAALRQQLGAFISHEMDAHRVMGLSIALVDDQRVLAAWGAGWADAASRQRAEADTIYRMGSISKLITDTAAMQFVAAGRLALDAPLRSALPGFHTAPRWGDAPITVRQVMTHHSGLPRDQLGGMWGEPVADFRKLVQDIADEPAAAPPGRAFAYSNLGLTLLGTALEGIAGVPFEAHVKRAVFDPLDMASASFSAAPPDDPRMARAYFKRELQREPALRDVPAGGLNASVTDLAKFMAMQFARGRNSRGEVVLPEPQWAEMLRTQNADVPLDVGFGVGLGWMLATLGDDTVHGGGPVAHHGGATFHFRSQLMILPDERLGVVVASNDGAAGQVVNRVAQRALALLLEAKTGRRQPARVPGFRPAASPWSDTAREACVGDYLSLAGLVSIRKHGDRLGASLGGSSIDLVEGEDGALGLRYKLAGLVPLSLGALDSMGLHCRTIEGRHVLVARQDGQEMLVADRLAPVTQALPPSLAALAGRYEPQLAPGERASIESVTVSVEQDRLWVQPRLPAAFGGGASLRLPLQLLSEGEAIVLGPLADSGPSIHLQRSSDGSHAIRYSGSVYRRIGD